MPFVVPFVVPHTVPHTVPMVRTQPEYLEVEITNGKGFDDDEYENEQFEITIRPYSDEPTHSDVVRRRMKFEKKENGGYGTQKKLSLVIPASILGLQSGQTIDINKVDIHQFASKESRYLLVLRINDAMLTAILGREQFEREALQYWRDCLALVNTIKGIY